MKIRDLTHDNKVFEYDNEKFRIEYSFATDTIFIRRLSDNKVIGILENTESIGFINEHDGVHKETGEEYTDFVVSYHDEKERTYISHYRLNNYEGYMKHIKTFETTSIFEDKIRVSNHTYKVCPDREECSLYNLDGKSRKFMIHEDHEKEIKEILGENTILVEETLHSTPEIEDRIVYGFDKDTFEPTTPIWSDLQRRFIDVHPLEEIRKLEWEKHMHYPFSEGEGQKLISRTIRLEILRYLDMLAEQLSREDIMYKNELPNKEFMMKLIDKN